ncbi:MAG: hypothetical protein ACLPYS_01200 [Vulcanimicrobiaceae bacterium]
MEEVSVGERFAQATEGSHTDALGTGTALSDDPGIFGRIRDLAAAHPLRLGVVAVALGVVLAVVIPTTRFENERLGEGADVAKERISARARDLWQRAKSAAQRASEAAVAAALEEFRREN